MVNSLFISRTENAGAYLMVGSTHYDSENNRFSLSRSVCDQNANRRIRNKDGCSSGHQSRDGLPEVSS